MAKPALPRQGAEPLSIAVIGLGGIGGVAAGCLQLTGRHSVIGCARRPLERMTLDLPDRPSVEVSFPVLTDPAQARPVDWVLLCTKVPDTDGAGPWLQALCTPSTRVAVLQNGVDHGDRIAGYANGARAVPLVVYYNGERIAHDHVRMRHVREMDISAPDDADGAAFIDLLAGTAIVTVPSPDFVTEMWRKLLINIVVNPITALTRQRQSVLRRDDIRALGAALLEEAVAVARAEGAALQPDEVARIGRTILTFPQDAGTSMYFDAMAGRSLEADALTGAVVNGGRRHGLATPMNAAVLALLRGLSDGIVRPETINR